MSDLRAQLQSVYDTHGKLTDTLVVNEARPEEHPLHSRFEWDDTVAGESWRRYQARDLIRSVRIIFRESADRQHGTVRAFHAMADESGHHYKPVEEIVRDDFQSRLLLQQMERDWRDLKARYEAFEEFWQMVNDPERRTA